MRRIVLLSVFILVSACYLAACQPTPEQDVVISKNKAGLESAIQATAEAGTGNAAESTADGNGDSNSAVIIPETELAIWEREISQGDMLYTLDAEVSQLKKQLPVLKVKAHTITSEEVKNFAYAIFGGDSYFFETRNVMTQAEIENRILNLTQWMNDTEGLLACANNNPEQAERDRQRFADEIAYWEERYQTAPEEYEPKPTDWKFYPQSYYDDELVILDGEIDICETDKNYYVKASVVRDGETWEVEAMNRDADSYMAHSMSYHINWEAIDKLPVVKMAEEEVLEMAEDLLTTIDTGKQWYLAECMHSVGEKTAYNKASDTYMLTYFPVYEGIPMQYYFSEGYDWEKEYYAPVYSQEKIQIRIMGGMVVDFEWSGAMDVVSIENPNAQVLSAEAIQERCMEQLSISYQPESFRGESVKEVQMAHMTIQKVECGFVRVLVPEARDEYYLIPSWNFWGNVKVDRGDGMRDLNEGFDMGGPYTTTSLRVNQESYLFLSALDGSVIDVSLGY